MGKHGVNHRIGVMGGSFNPVHCGHLSVARDVKATLKLDRMALMPAAQSPLKGMHSVSAEHRAAMLELAVASHPELDLDLRELSRKGPSYTFDSLTELREALGLQASLYFIMGDDLLPSLARWSRWQEILHYAHVVVVSRPGVFPAVPATVKKWWNHHEMSLEALHQSSCGGVSRVECPLVNVSSTAIRAAIELGSPVSEVIPDAVLEYITRHNLYAVPSQAEANP
ncbi:nicotinate-nucleotide adenylyltransferase [Luminiphilus sp.]|nr:nicotinate-nucleotide adenylyltransferase [Luminiphilus sp.]